MHEYKKACRNTHTLLSHRFQSPNKSIFCWAGDERVANDDAQMKISSALTWSEQSFI